MLLASKVLLLQPESKAHLPTPHRASGDSRGPLGPICLSSSVSQVPS